jgi:hypothetical protein
LTRPAPSLLTSAFPREFARFVALVDGDRLRKAIVKATDKCCRLPPALRGIFADRYEIHEQLLAFEDGPAAFQLDAADPRAVRAASFILGVNRMAARLGDAGRSNLAARVVGDLAPAQDIRHLELEIMAAHHLEAKGLSFRLADQEGLGNFDFLVDVGGREIEVECKTATGTTGADIKEERQVIIGTAFLKRCQQGLSVPTGGVFVLTFKKPIAGIRNLAGAVTDALRRRQGGSIESDDLDMEWHPRPAWQAAFDRNDRPGFLIEFERDEAIGRDFSIQTTKHGRPLALVARPYKRPSLPEKLTDIIQEAGSQCSRTRPAVIWLGLLGQDEAEFRRLAEFSMASKGGGLNAIFANSFHPSIDRRHIAAARFSVMSRRVDRRPALGPDRVLTSAHSVGGTVYDIPNLNCSFGAIDGF